MCEQERAERIGDKVISLESLELRDTVCTCGGRLCACVEEDHMRMRGERRVCMCGAVIMQYCLNSGIFVATLLSYDRELHFLSRALTSKSEFFLTRVLSMKPLTS